MFAMHSSFFTCIFSEASSFLTNISPLLVQINLYLSLLADCFTNQNSLLRDWVRFSLINSLATASIEKSVIFAASFRLA